jgi:NAD(P)-dependent dehydrogenase (short-subunit alcohol dehydrogenase family)
MEGAEPVAPLTDPAMPVAVVTGASSGIGLAVARTLARRGFRVIATMRRVASAPEALRDHPSVVLHPLDVTSDESVAALAAWLMDDANAARLDVVVNNAGIGQSGTVETVPIDVAKQVFEVNVWGVMRVCRDLLPVVRHRGRGGIFHLVSAGMGLHGFPCNDIYVSSKFAYVARREGSMFYALIVGSPERARPTTERYSTTDILASIVFRICFLSCFFALHLEVWRG